MSELKENARRDFTFSWIEDKRIDIYTIGYPKVFVFSIDSKEGFEGVNSSENGYSIKYKGKELDLLRFLKQPYIKKELKKGIESIEKRTESLEKYLKYADHGAYGQDKRKISVNKQALEILKKYK